MTGASFSVVVIVVKKWTEIWTRAVGSSLPRSVWSVSGERGLSLRRVGASWKTGAVVRGKTCARLCRRDASDGDLEVTSSVGGVPGHSSRRHRASAHGSQSPAAASASPSSVSRDGQLCSRTKAHRPGAEQRRGLMRSIQRVGAATLFLRGTLGSPRNDASPARRVAPSSSSVPCPNAAPAPARVPHRRGRAFTVAASAREMGPPAGRGEGRARADSRASMNPIRGDRAARTRAPRPPAPPRTPRCQRAAPPR